MPAAVNHFKAGQVQQILDVLNRCPVKQRLRILEPSMLCQRQNRLPEVTIPMDNEPRARVTNVTQPFKYQVDVVEIADKIGQDDEVELLSWELQVLCGHLAKC